MSEMTLLRTVIWREIFSRRKAFLVTTGLIVALVVGGIAIGGVASANADGGTPGISVGVVGGDAVEFEQRLRIHFDPNEPIEITVGEFELERGKDALRAEELDALVVGHNDVFWGPTTENWMMSPVTSTMFTLNLDRTADEIGLTEGEVAMILAPISAQTIDYGERDDSEAEEVLAVITVILMFVGILAYGQWIAYGVVEEKASRVAELILGAVSPHQLLTAKMVALGGMGLTQLLLVTGLGLVAANAFLDFALPPVAFTAAAWLVFWFVVGFSFYGSLYAASGSLAADTQEAGSFIGPLNLLPGIGYALGVIAFPSGSDALARVLSLIPFWSPMLMPGRIATGSVAGWELAVAIVLTIASTIVVVRLSGRVYLGGITQATRRVSWRQAFRGGEDLSGA